MKLKVMVDMLEYIIEAEEDATGKAWRHLNVTNNMPDVFYDLVYMIENAVGLIAETARTAKTEALKERM